MIVRVAPNAITLGAADTAANPRYIENQLTLAHGSAVEAATRATHRHEPELSVRATEQSDIFTFTATQHERRKCSDRGQHPCRRCSSRRSGLRRSRSSRSVEPRSRSSSQPSTRGEIDVDRRDEFERDLERVILSIELATNGGSTIVDAGDRPVDPVRADSEPDPAPCRRRRAPDRSRWRVPCGLSRHGDPRRGRPCAGVAATPRLR